MCAFVLFNQRGTESSVHGILYGRCCAAEEQASGWRLRAAAAASGDIAELRMMTLDVVLAPSNGVDR